MNIKECYDKLGGGYEEVLGRLRSERIIQKFVLKFPGDGSYQLLLTSVKNEDWEEAFRAAHTLKGVCQNLGFTRLYRSISAMTELFRGGKREEAVQMLPQVDEDYRVTVEAIAELS